VQDAAAAPRHLFEEVRGVRVADLCAAPGGRPRRRLPARGHRRRLLAGGSPACAKHAVELAETVAADVLNAA
jgi:hypothetical protein